MTGRSARLHTLEKKLAAVTPVGSITLERPAPTSARGAAGGEMLASSPTVFLSVGSTLRVTEPSHARMAATVAAESASSLTLRSSCGFCRLQRKRPQREFVLPAKDRPSEDPMTAHLERLRQRRMMEHMGTKGVRSMEHRPPTLGPLWAISQDTLPLLTPIVACHRRYLLRLLPLWVTRTLLPLSLPLSPLQRRPLCHCLLLMDGRLLRHKATFLPCLHKGLCRRLLCKPQFLKVCTLDRRVRIPWGQRGMFTLLPSRHTGAIWTV